MGRASLLSHPSLTELSFVKEATAEQQILSSRKRFAVLDGLRGVAALVVVLYHSFDSGGIVPNGELAVDLFFILSGFVITYSWDDRLVLPTSKGQFVLSRLIRLYPMLFIGALGGIVFGVIHNFTNPSQAYSYPAGAISAVLSLLVLPYLQPNSLNNFVFTFSPPIWSLFFEVVANGAYVLFVRFLSIRVLTALLVIGMIGVVSLGDLGGDQKTNFVAGFPRVIAGFFGGVLLFKLWRSGQLPMMRANIFISSAIILTIFVFSIKIRGWLYIPAFGLLMVAVINGINSRPARTDGWCEFLGLVSYPVYLVHPMTLYMIMFIGHKITLSDSLFDVFLVGHLIAILFVGYIFARYYETPARLFLKRTLNCKKLDHVVS